MPDPRALAQPAGTVPWWQVDLSASGPLFCSITSLEENLQVASLDAGGVRCFLASKETTANSQMVSSCLGAVRTAATHLCVQNTGMASSLLSDGNFHNQRGSEFH